MDGLKVGDQIVINKSAEGRYAYSVPGSIGKIDGVYEDFYTVRFPTLPQWGGYGWEISKKYCDPLIEFQGPPEHPVHKKIKQMELRHKKRMEKKHADALVFF